MNLYYDYEKQCWIENNKVAKCGHQTPLKDCYACNHAGETCFTYQDNTDK